MDNLSIVFSGDVGFDKYMDGMWEDDELIAPDVLDFVRSGDHFVINVEGPLSKREKVVRENGVSALTHSMNPEVADFFEKIGADVYNICNNHIMDAGSKGMRDTLDIAARKHVKTLGAGMNIDEAKAPVFFDEAGGIGLIGVGYDRACRKADKDTPGCLNFSDMDMVRQQIECVKKRCRYCIVVAHDGEEFTAIPSPYTRSRYISYLDMGADIVIAHHPHVPMNYETFSYDINNGLKSASGIDNDTQNSNGTDRDVRKSDGKCKKMIFYSLGNFIFDTDYQRSQYNTEYGVLVKLNFTYDAFDFEPLGIKIDRESEHIIKWDLPKIFTEVNADEYELLKPLGAKMFIENTKRQLKYLKPDQFKNATDDDFYKNFYEPMRSGRVEGKLLDFQIIYPLSLEYEKREWALSSLEEVKDYMLNQIRTNR